MKAGSRNSEDYAGAVTAAVIALLGGTAFLLARADAKLMLLLILMLIGLLGAIFLDRAKCLEPTLLLGLGFFCIINPNKSFGVDFTSTLPVFGAVTYQFLSALDLTVLLLILTLFSAGRWPEIRRKTLRRLLPSATRLCLYGFVLIMGLSLSYAYDRSQAVPHFVFELKCLVLFLVTAELTSSGRSLSSVLGWIMGGLCLGMVLETLLVVLEYRRIIGGEMVFLGVTVGSFQETLAGGAQLFRVGGTYRHPNYLAVPAAALALFFWQIQAAFHSGLPRRKVYWLACLGSGLCLVLSFSRGGWAACVGGAMVYVALLLALYGKRWLKSLPWHVLGPLSVFTLVLLFVFSGQLYDKIFHSSPINLTSRAELNELTIDIIQQRPLLGGGIGNHTALLEEYDQAASWIRRMHLMPMVHNIYLLVASEIGLIGALLYFGMPLTLFGAGIRACFRRPARPEVSLVVALISSLLVFLVADMFGPSLRKIEVVTLFWLFMGCLAGVTSSLADPTEPAEGAASRAPAAPGF